MHVRRFMFDGYVDMFFLFRVVVVAECKVKKDDAE